MRSLRIAASAAILIALMAVPASAQVTVDKLDLGTHVYGERLAPEDLAGRTVVVFFWDLG